MHLFLFECAFEDDCLLVTCVCVCTHGDVCVCVFVPIPYVHEMPLQGLSITPVMLGVVSASASFLSKLSS